MRVMIGRIAALALAAGLLAGCGSNGSRNDAGDDRTAAGEVRGGTISDNMLPLDTVRSQSPPLKTSGSGEAAASDEPADVEGGTGEGTGAGSAAATPAEAAPSAPAAQ